MIILTILSLLLLGGFTALSCALFFGVPASYSAFSAEWRTMYPKTPVWSYVTALAAFLMVPPMIEAGDGSALQFLGFFAPLYLIVVALTPEWDINKRQHIIHTAGAIVCAVLALAWLFVIRGHWWVAAGCYVLALGAALWTKTLRPSLVFWGEVVMFLSVYVSLFIE